VTAFNLTVRLASLTARLKADAPWDDEYPAWQEYADECESLLTFAQNHGVLDRFWPRLRAKKQQRDEALNELRVAYFLDSIGYPVVEWEPKDADNYTLEFAVSLGDSGSALVEVKSPGWESELSERERNAGRKELPKYLPLEPRAAGPIEVIRRTLEKARPKFTGRAPTILFISDDCFVDLGEWGWGPIQMALLQDSVAYGPGLFHSRDYAAIGAVCLFWNKAPLGQEGIQFNTTCAANPNAMATARVPEHLLKALRRRPRYAGA
jgi:hypothetical protein